jgi:hypothetical protein
MQSNGEVIMATPLHVLVLEDRPTDAELVLRELRRVGFDPDWQRVETEQNYVIHLDPALDLIFGFTVLKVPSCAFPFKSAAR